MNIISYLKRERMKINWVGDVDLSLLDARNEIRDPEDLVVVAESAPFGAEVAVGVQGARIMDHSAVVHNLENRKENKNLSSLSTGWSLCCCTHSTE